MSDTQITFCGADMRGEDDRKERGMTKDEKFQIGMALNKIALSLNDEDFQKVKEYLKDIEKIVAKQTDTAEVVRCKDCKHRYYADNRVPHERTWVCEHFINEEITDNDFCSFGERRE